MGIIQRKKAILLNEPHVETCSGSMVDFETDVPASLKECKIDFIPYQEGYGDPSPENVRPIIGWDKIDLYQNGGLPSEYQQVEYIQSSGGPLIDTGYSPKFLNADEFEIVFSVNSAGTKIVFGTSNFRGNPAGYGQLPIVGYQPRRDFTGNFSYFGTLQQDKFTTFKIANGEESCLGVSYSYNESAFSENTENIYLFGQGPSETSTRLIGKISKAVYKNNGKTVFYLIPCYRKSDNVIGMYDLITKTFKVNVGTGSFEKGPDYAHGNSVSVTFPSTSNNLLKISGLEQVAVNPTTFSNTTKRTFTKGTYVKGLTYNNYCQTTVSITGISVSDNSITFTTSARAYGIAVPLFNLAIGAQYTVSAIRTGTMSVSFYQEDGTFISYQSFTSSHYDYTTFTVPIGTHCTVICFGGLTDSVEATFTNIMLSEGSSPIPYEPYTNTLYGGYVDLTTGELIATNKMVYANDLRWANYSGFAIFYTGVSADHADRSADSMDISDKLVSYNNYSWNLAPDNSIISGNRKNFFIKHSGVTNYSEFASWLEEVDPIICYKLETPVVYRLTPQQIKSLRGSNNIISDVSGNITVQYWTH